MCAGASLRRTRRRRRRRRSALPPRPTAARSTTASGNDTRLARRRMTIRRTELAPCCYPSLLFSLFSFARPRFLFSFFTSLFVAPLSRFFLSAASVFCCACSCGPGPSAATARPPSKISRRCRAAMLPLSLCAFVLCKPKRRGIDLCHTLSNMLRSAQLITEELEPVRLSTLLMLECARVRVRPPWMERPRARARARGLSQAGARGADPEHVHVHGHGADARLIKQLVMANEKVKKKAGSVICLRAAGCSANRKTSWDEGLPAAATGCPSRQLTAACRPQCPKRADARSSYRRR